MSEPYISDADLEVFMDTDLLDGPRASLAVAAAMQAVRKYLGQEITRVAADIVALDGTGKDTIRLPQRPVIEVTSVKEDDVELGAADYLARDSLIVRTDGAVFLLGRGNITVVYSHGWCVGDIVDSDDACESVPADIILATLSAARRAYQTFGEAAAGGIKSETMGGYSYQLSDAETATGVELIRAEKAVLDSYSIRSSSGGKTR